jgi:hypothetical protein
MTMTALLRDVAPARLSLSDRFALGSFAAAVGSWSLALVEPAKPALLLPDPSPAGYALLFAAWLLGVISALLALSSWRGTFRGLVLTALGCTGAFPFGLAYMSLLRSALGG